MSAMLSRRPLTRRSPNQRNRHVGSLSRAKDKCLRVCIAFPRRIRGVSPSATDCKCCCSHASFGCRKILYRGTMPHARTRSPNQESLRRAGGWSPTGWRQRRGRRASCAGGTGRLRQVIIEQPGLLHPSATAAGENMTQALPGGILRSLLYRTNPRCFTHWPCHVVELKNMPVPCGLSHCWAGHRAMLDSVEAAGSAGNYLQHATSHH